MHNNGSPDSACLTLRGIKAAVLAVQVVVVDVRKIPADLLPCMAYHALSTLDMVGTRWQKSVRSVLRFCEWLAGNLFQGLRSVEVSCP